MIRRSIAAIAAATLAWLAVFPAPATGQPPGEPPAAPRDTSWAGMFARHGWAEAGVGWLTAPASVRPRFEPGQGFAAGLEAQPVPRLRLRVGADVQTLLANAVARYEVATQGPDETIDSLEFQVQSRAWSLALRGEAGWRAPAGIWLWAGGGGGYFDGGVDRSIARTGDVVLRVTEAAPDRWGWTVTLGAARSLQPFLPWPIGLDVHWRSLLRPDGDLRQWAVRVAWMRP